MKKIHQAVKNIKCISTPGDLISGEATCSDAERTSIPPAEGELEKWGKMSAQEFTDVCLCFVFSPANDSTDL